MKCDDCPVRDECAGDPMTLARKVLADYQAVIAMLMAVLSRASLPIAVATAFLAGYAASRKERESSQVDMDVWGECFDG